MLSSFNTCHLTLINDEFVLKRIDKPAEFFDSSQTPISTKKPGLLTTVQRLKKDREKILSNTVKTK